MSSSKSGLPLVGRAHELGALRTALERALSGQGKW